MKHSLKVLSLKKKVQAPWWFQVLIYNINIKEMSDTMQLKHVIGRLFFKRLNELNTNGLKVKKIILTLLKTSLTNQI